MSAPDAHGPPNRLHELFPEARIVSIARHPVQVVASHLDMPWAPHDVARVCHWLEPIYRRWFAFLDAHSEDERHVHVSLEELAADWPESRRALFERLGLDDAPTTATLSPGRVDHFDQLSPSDHAYVANRLGFAIDRLGYA